jgi:hypothetical protein|tara:strand:+ start:160 stop:738 length:579 start_codon:yes stop_codon:yes gene_type:complete
MINLYHFNDNNLYLIITLAWYFGGILMQLWEALLWKDYKCKLISKIAMINNLIQPVLWLFILFIPGYIKRHKINYKLVYVLLASYIMYMSRYFKNDYGCIKTKEGISLKWWDNNIGGFIYTLFQILLFILILPTKLLKSQLSIFLASLFLGTLFRIYEDKSNAFNIKSWGKTGSIWCWVAAFSPLINFMVLN